MFFACLNFLIFPLNLGYICHKEKKKFRGDEAHSVKGLRAQRRWEWKQVAGGELASAGGHLSWEPQSGAPALHRHALSPSAVGTQHDQGACVGVGG